MVGQTTCFTKLEFVPLQERKGHSTNSITSLADERCGGLEVEDCTLIWVLDFFRLAALSLSS